MKTCAHCSFQWTPSIKKYIKTVSPQWHPPHLVCPHCLGKNYSTWQMRVNLVYFTLAMLLLFVQSVPALIAMYPIWVGLQYWQMKTAPLQKSISGL